MAVLPPEPAARFRRRHGRRRHPHRCRRQLGRYFQPGAGREDRAPSRSRPRDDPLRISRRTVAACKAEPFRPAPCRTIRALCLRGRARERLRRAHRCRRAAQAARASRWRRRSSIYGERYPIDEDFLCRAAVMPPACGVALGFDRLVMLATGRHAHRAGAVDADVRTLNDRSQPGRKRCWRSITMTCRSARRR